MLLENAVRLEDVELPSKFARSVCENPCRGLNMRSC
jgi:hypothetical protein